jgi:hypothetical protein
MLIPECGNDSAVHPKWIRNGARIRAAGHPRRHHHESVKEVTATTLPPNETVSDVTDELGEILREILDESSMICSMTWR